MIGYLILHLFTLIGILTVFVWSCAIVGVFFGRGPNKVSERAVLHIAQLATWLEDVAATLDGAIVRYRLERRQRSIDLQSTAERMASMAIVRAAE